MPQNLNDNIEKLLEIVEKGNQPVRTKQKVDKSLKYVQRYIQANNIKPGDTCVDSVIVYYHYYNWVKTRATRVARKKFLIEFGKYFEKTYNSGGRCYKLNPEPFDITPEGYFKARALYRRQKQHGKRKKGNKKK